MSASQTLRLFGFLFTQNFSGCQNFRGVCEYIDYLVEQSLSQLR